MSEDVIWVHASPVTIESGTFEEHSDPRSLIRFSGPIREEWKDALTARGIRIEFWAPPFGACVTLPDAFPRSELARFPFLAGAIAYRQEHCRRDVPPASGMPDDVVDIICFGREVRPSVEQQLRAMGVEILSSASSKIRVRYSGDLAALRDLTGVKIADAARAVVALAASVALREAPPLPLPPAGLDGSGEIIAVADTGLDSGVDDATMHPDFHGRIELLASWPTNPTWFPFIVNPEADDGPADLASGHGTHVAGLALGNGLACGGVHRGGAPAARLVFQALEHFCRVKPDFERKIASGYLFSGRPIDLRDLFTQARDRGARIHVNSWGDAATGAYTDDCFEADLFLHEHQDAVILFAAGNDGADRDGDGRIEPRSLYAPAAAKNVIAIGATEGPDADSGVLATWGDFDPRRQRYCNPIDRKRRISGDVDRIACFSSTGPTADGRIKPDLCAPGTNMAAPRSRACNGRGWGLADPLPHYMYEGGTSAATGTAGGLVALVRQAWRARAISGAALKAILIAAARDVRGRGRNSFALVNEGGYGRIDVAASVPERVTLFEETAGVRTGDERLFPIDIPPDALLRAALCWYDAAGERLINDLDLTLLRPDGTALARVPDRVNTVELIAASALPAGRYTLKVSAFNVPAGPQPFALAVSIRTASDQPQ